MWSLGHHKVLVLARPIAKSADPLGQLIQQQVAASASDARAKWRWLAFAGGSAALGLLAYCIYVRYFRGPQPDPDNTNTCGDNCAADQVCVERQCQSNALQCTTDKDCGACNSCTAGGVRR